MTDDDGRPSEPKVIDVKPENVPDALRERRQWVCWRYKWKPDRDEWAKVPVDPLNGHNAKPNDPETWRDWSTAWDFYDDDHTDADGLGFVFSADGPVAGVDLDGCRDPETQTFDGWARDILAELDTYAEVSPSATGAHALVFGEVPEGGYRSGDVEMYDHGRFFTVTGAHLGMTPSTVEDRQDALDDVHAEFIADGDDENAGGGEVSAVDAPGFEGSDEELIEKAKNAKNGEKFRRLWNGRTSGYDSHSEARMALLNLLAFWTGGDRGQMDRLFRESGLYPHPDKPGKWDRVGDDEIDEAVSARTEFYEPGGGRQARRREEKLADLVDAGDLSDEEAATLATLAARVPAGVYDEYREDVRKVLGWDAAELDRHRGLQRHEAEWGRIQVENGRTYFIRDETPRQRWEVLNFPLDVRSILELDGGEMIEAEIGPGRRIQFSPKVFQRTQRFKDLIGDYVGLTFDAGSASTAVLNELNEYVGRLDVPRRRGTHHIGLHGEEWVVPDGALRTDGWADEPETVYVERDIGFERKVTLQRGDSGFDDDDVRAILTSLPDTRATGRFLPVLAWFYAAPLRPYIFEEWNAGQFNHLNITGDTGSGKTTTLRYLWRCFGVDGDPHAVADTKFALTATMAASAGVPVWYDEYKPSDIQDYKLTHFHDLYRKAATGGVETRGNPDQTTTEYELRAPLVVTGEEQIQPPAERRRSIMVAFREDVTDKDTDTRRAFKTLAGEGHIENGDLVLPSDAPDPTNHAMAYYRWLAGADPADLRAKWADARELVWQIRDAWETDHQLDDMEIQGLRTVAFGWMIMRAFGQHHGVDVDALPGRDDLEAGLAHVAGEIGPDGHRKSHLDEFVELFERANAAGYVEDGQHFAFVREGQGDEELRIHLPRTFDVLSKYVADHDLDSHDLLSNAVDYRKRFKEAANTDGGYVTTSSQKTPGLGRCVGISTVLAMNDLDFDRSAFDVDPMGDDGGSGAAEDGGDHGPTDAKHQILQHLRLAHEAGDLVSPPAVAGVTGVDPETVADRMDTLAEEGRMLARRDHGEFEVLS